MGGHQFSCVSSEPSAAKIEDPGRLKAFMTVIQGIDWASGVTTSNLQPIFNAVDGLAVAEASYYYSARKTRLKWSNGLRLAGWIFGTAGTLIPLAAATRHPRFHDWNPWGYVLIALSAAMFAANALFQGTAGHIRFVTTQLQIERLITLTRLEWVRFVAGASTTKLTEEERGRALDLLKVYATELYTLIISETGEWSQLMQSQIDQYQKNLQQAQDSSKTKI